VQGSERLTSELQGWNCEQFWVSNSGVVVNCRPINRDGNSRCAGRSGQYLAIRFQQFATPLEAINEAGNLHPVGYECMRMTRLRRLPPEIRRSMSPAGVWRVFPTLESLPGSWRAAPEACGRPMVPGSGVSYPGGNTRLFVTQEVVDLQIQPRDRRSLSERGPPSPCRLRRWRRPRGRWRSSLCTALVTIRSRSRECG
jgi:hypothetical protein